MNYTKKRGVRIRPRGIREVTYVADTDYAKQLDIEPTDPSPHSNADRKKDLLVAQAPVAT